MAEFLTTHRASYEIENIMTTAQKRLVLISPYWRISKTLVERVRDADRRGVRITLLYGKTRRSEIDTEAAREIGNLAIYFLENLHAKCYFNEARMVITSMNLHEFSEKNNREMGILLTKGEPAFHTAIAEVESMIAAAEAVLDRTGAPSRRGRWADRGRSPTHGDGYCIRCGRRTALEPEMPFCDSCFDVWSRFENEWFPERLCHACGAESDTSMAKPLCYRCYRQMGF